YGMFSDDEVMILLKRSFWGRGKYKYVPQLESFEDRKNHFGVLTQESHSSDGFDEQTKKLKEDMINGMLFEKIAFCDYLFKPMGAIVKYHSNEKDFVRNGDNSKDISLSRFIIEIHFPGFIHSKSDVIYSVIGNAKDTKVKLVTNSKNNTVQNDLNAIFTFYKEGGALLQFEINEAELTSHKVKKIFQHKGDTYIFETKKKYKGTDDGKGMDYQVYNLSLEYRYPSGFPVVLKYPKVVINDYKGTFAFWRDDQEFEDITMERATQ
ncbi:MAG: hypothetical protein KKA05_10240, partial [Alphaproteobacteria bacterium]|nr:hypothetical protein [Alphaproteobacteria bacterium]